MGTIQYSGLRSRTYNSISNNFNILIMASLNSLYIKKETLKTLLDTLEAKQEKGVELTVALNDEVNQYGQNVSAWVSQTKEQREEKKQRFFTGNGKTFWSDGKITVAKEAQPEAAETAKDEQDLGLPF